MIHNETIQKINERLKLIEKRLDAIDIVRCKDCKHYELYCGWTGKGWFCFLTNSRREEEDFCSRGERREDADSDTDT